MIDEGELLRRLAELGTDVQVVFVRLDHNDDDIREIREEQRHSRRLIVASLFTVVMTLVVTLISMMTAGAPIT